MPLVFPPKSEWIVEVVFFALLLTHCIPFCFPIFVVFAGGMTGRCSLRWNTMFTRVSLHRFLRGRYNNLLHICRTISHRWHRVCPLLCGFLDHIGSTSKLHRTLTFSLLCVIISIGFIPMPLSMLHHRGGFFLCRTHKRSLSFWCRMFQTRLFAINDKHPWDRCYISLVP